MNTPNRPLPNRNLTDSQLDHALCAESDTILPSSGFAGRVLSAVLVEGPEPLPFPWKRAWPGIVSGAILCACVLIALVRTMQPLLASATHATSAPGAELALIAPILHSGTSPDVVWPLAALAIPLACLLLVRRILPGR